MKLKHFLITLAIASIPLAAYQTRHWPVRYLYYSYGAYLGAKSLSWAIEYCEQLHDRTSTGLSDGQYEFCLGYVSKIKLKRLESISSPGQRFPDIVMLMTDI